MSLIYSEWPEAAVVELVVSGRVTRADYAGVAPRLQSFIDRHGSVSVIEVIERFDGFDPSILIPGIAFDLRNLSRVRSVAVVSDIGWIGPVTRAAGTLTAITMRVFPLDALSEARAWIRETLPETVDG